jgi:chemotaxis protein MotA
MDIATLAGLLIGAFFVLYGIVTGEMKTDNLWAFVNPSAMMIVGGGLLGAVAISFPVKELLRIPKVLMVCFRRRTDSPVELISKLVRFAEVARRDGILALEGVTDTIDDEFLIRGIQLAVDGTDPELIEQIMNTELDNLAERHTAGRRLFDGMTKYAPAWGMIGTVIGLILMLKGLSAGADPGAIGRGMAVALVTTFYGAVLANYLFNPISDKLVGRQDQEMLMRNIVVRGVLAIQSGDNPRIVEQKLRIFLPPHLRAVQRTR